MKIIDPTYLRSIYDGLNSGAIHKDNASALPTGLVGMYEAAFPPTSNVNDRNKVLDFFAVWSLLRREVSAAFVLPLLEGWTEGQLLEYIAQYSKWFNSPFSGKYQLYHERFRAFILQKISHQQFSTFNNLIINQCQRALLEKNGNEWELYALECLSTHLLAESMISGNGKALLEFSRSREVWNRQIEFSSSLKWSFLSINKLIDFHTKYEPLACKEDYHNILILQKKSIDFIKYFNDIDLLELKEFHIERLCSLTIDNDFDAQLLYVSIIVKMHKIVCSDFEDLHIKSLIVKFDLVLFKIQSINHGRLCFHDIIPLIYFVDIINYYKRNNIEISNLLSGTYLFKDFENQTYQVKSSFTDFMEDSFFPTDHFNLPVICDEINRNIKTINLLKINSLDQLYQKIKKLKIELDEIPISIIAIPILFNKKFQKNLNYQFILSEWRIDFVGIYNSVYNLAFILCYTKSDVNTDYFSLQKQIEWLVTNLFSNKYDADEFISYISEYIFWKDGKSKFENWILEILPKSRGPELISRIDDQKYQVIIDFYWNNDDYLIETLRDLISPINVSYYIEEANKSRNASFKGKILSVNDIYGLDSKDFFEHDFVLDYFRNLYSNNSPVSVSNIDWVSILPKLKGIDFDTLYYTMHKVFLNSLCYNNATWNELPSDACEFYELSWLDLIKLKKIKIN